MIPHDFRRIALAYELLPVPAFDAEREGSREHEDHGAVRTGTPAIPGPHDQAA